MGQQQRPVDEGRIPDEFQQTPRVDAVEVWSVQVACGQADGLYQKGLADTRQSFRTIPTTRASGAGADDVDVAIDAHGLEIGFITISDKLGSRNIVIMK